MESGGSVKSPFNLLNNDEDYIINNFETIYPVLIECLTKSTEETITLKALTIAFGPGLNFFSLEEIEDQLLKISCPVAKNLLILTLKGIENLGAAKNSSQTDTTEISCNLLYVCEDIISQIINVFEQTSRITTINLLKIKSLLICSSEILFESYNHCLKSRECYGSYFSFLTKNLTSFFKKAQELQSNLLNLLTKIEINFEEIQILTLNEILTFVFKSGIALLDLDIRTMADLWKGYVNLIQKYSELLKNHHEISIPIQCLANHMVNEIENFISQGNEVSQNFITTIKILCFTLKIIIKLVENFSGQLEKCQNSIMKLIFALNKISDPFIEKLKFSIPENADHLKQLVIGVDPLLSHLINDSDFFQEFAATSRIVKSNSDQIFEFLLLCCLIVKKLVLSDVETRKLWFDSDNNIIDWIFSTVISCNYELSSDIRFPGILIPGKSRKMMDLYEYLLINISAFLLMSTSKEFILVEKLLLKYILQPNPWCSLLAADTWCLLVRYANADVCHYQLIHLCRIFLQFKNTPSQPEKIFLGCLIKRIFPLMSDKHRDSFHKIYSPEEYPLLWQFFGTHHLSTDCQNTVKNILIHSVTQKINKFITNNGSQSLNFFDMESALRILHRRLRLESDPLKNSIAKLWEFNSIKLASCPLGERYIKSLCNATNSLTPFKNSKNILLVLKQIKALLPSLNPSCFLFCVEILENLAKTVIPADNYQNLTLKEISLLFNYFLTNQNIFVHARSTEVFSKFASFTSHTQIIKESINNNNSLQSRLTNYLLRKHPLEFKDWKISDYLKSLGNIKYEHVCKQDSLKSFNKNCDEPSAKKMKFDENVQENTEIENIIYYLKSEVIKLSENASILSDLHKKELKYVYDILYSILK